MHTWKENRDSELAWINFLKDYNVYFSYPYDLDWLMLNKFLRIIKVLFLKMEAQDYQRVMIQNMTRKLNLPLLQF